ncbi:MAG: hypothetical protein U1F36_09830 [Planctomycetota bacterium]
MAARSALRLATLGLALCAACSALPEDHGLRTALAGIGRDLRTTGAKLGTAFDAAIGDAAQIPRDLGRVATTAEERGQSLLTSSIAAAKQVPAQIGAGGHSLIASTGDLVGRADADLHRLTARGVVGAPVDDGIRDLRRSLTQLPSLLRLDRHPMAEPGDPEHETSLRPSLRPRSWLERILRRMGLTR